MKNWSGNQIWNPKKFIQPSSTDELISVITNAIAQHKKIRVYGSKYSSSALNNTDCISLNLDNKQGLVEIDKENHLITVKSGTKLSVLNALLSENGLALENMVEIDKQSIAGAIATGTHATGVYFGNISTQVVAIKFINGLGEEVFCSAKKNPELFKCMQVSLGSLGIITEITLSCLSDYKLKLDKKTENLDKVLTNIQSYNFDNRHFEHYWFPYTNRTLTKVSNITNFKTDDDSFINFFNDSVLENYGLFALGSLAKTFSSLNVLASKISSRMVSDSTKIKPCKDIFVLKRKVKFNEMEYSIPLDAYEDAFKDVVKLVNSRKYKIHYPIESCFVKKDDIYLSPSYDRDSAYISCHVFKGKDYLPYFKALEEIFTAYQGRPHWGKIHFKKADYLASVYPMFATFNKHRKEQDPHGIFLNEHLKEILN